MPNEITDDTSFCIDVKTIKKIVEYLEQRPYREVVEILNTIRRFDAEFVKMHKLPEPIK